MTSGNGKSATLQTLYYIDGYVVRLAGFNAGYQGEPHVLYSVEDEFNRQVLVFGLPRSKVSRREDVLLEAKKHLGIWPTEMDEEHAEVRT